MAGVPHHALDAFFLTSDKLSSEKEREELLPPATGTTHELADSTISLAIELPSTDYSVGSAASRPCGGDINNSAMSCINKWLVRLRY